MGFNSGFKGLSRLFLLLLILGSTFVAPHNMIIKTSLLFILDSE